MAVVAPSTDPQGALIDSAIARLQTLVGSTHNPFTNSNLQQQLNALQVQAVDHYMVTGWLNAATVLQTFSPPPWDDHGQKVATRIVGLTTLYNNAVAAGMPAGNSNGYGASGWTTIASAFAQQLYAKQIELVEWLMTLPGGTTAATILSTLTGLQTAPAGIPYAYSFSSVGFTDAWIAD